MTRAEAAALVQRYTDELHHYYDLGLLAGVNLQVYGQASTNNPGLADALERVTKTARELLDALAGKGAQ